MGKAEAILRAGLRLCRFVTRRRLPLLGAGLLLTGATLAGLLHIRRQADATLEEERSRLAAQGLIPFVRAPRIPLNRPEIRFIQSAAQTRAIARYGDAYFVATGGGLLKLSDDGAVVQHYTVLDGLAESDLTALAVFQGKLYIGTQTAGLLEFDGNQFVSLQWTDRQAQAVTALLERDGRLLVGTFAGGLLEFDGRNFRELRAGDTRLRGVTVLAQDSTRLFAGTFDDGLWLYEAARWQHFTKNDGLLSNRVTGIVATGPKLYAATDFGLSEADLSAPQFRPVATRPTLSGLAQVGAQLWLIQDDGLIHSFNPNARRAPQCGMRIAECGLKSAERSGILQSAFRNPHSALGSAGARFAQTDGKLWLMSNLGLWRSEAGRNFAAFGPRQQPLTDNTISALALDANGQLWAGSFRHGLDILAQGRRIAHRETPEIQEINALVPDGAIMYAATSQGLFRAGSEFSFQAAAPLCAAQAKPCTPNAILHLVSTREGLVMATNRGLAWGAKRLTTVQGLPSNSLYAVLLFHGKLYAGTLGGLAVIENGAVSRVFKDSNSALSHNWVSALAGTEERLFVGTYGGGVFELDAAGELRRLGEKFTVNPNALHTDGARLYAGTLTGAWAYDFRAQTWTQLRDELPAPTVLSVTSDDHYIYFGTTSGIVRIEKDYLTQRRGQVGE